MLPISRMAVVYVALALALVANLGGKSVVVPGSDPMARAPGTTLRVATWNVRNFPQERSGDKFTAIDADIWLLHEVASKRAGDLEQWLPPDTMGVRKWNVLVDGMIAIASRSRLERAFGPPALRSARTIYGAFEEWLFGPTVVDAIGGRSMTSNGPLVSMSARLTGDAQQRRLQASVLDAAVTSALPAGRHAVVLGGNLNLAGSKSPTEIIGARLNGGAPLSTVDAMQLDGLSNATWRALSKGKSGASRLDYILYSGSTLESLRAFVFEAADLPADWLTHHRLQVDMSLASDHLPVVVDFRWRR